MMKRNRRFSLRGFLCFVFLLCILFAMAANWYGSRAKQIQDVDGLIKLAQETEKLGLYDRTLIIVFYDKDLVWLEDEGRYAFTFKERDGFFAWCNDNIGLDFFESPTAIEIICPSYDETGISDEMVEQINKLDSVKQIWVTSHSNAFRDENRCDLIDELFPGVISAPLHRNTQLPIFDD